MRRGLLLAQALLLLICSTATSASQVERPFPYSWLPASGASVAQNSSLHREDARPCLRRSYVLAILGYFPRDYGSMPGSLGDPPVIQYRDAIFVLDQCNVTLHILWVACWGEILYGMSLRNRAAQKRL